MIDLPGILYKDKTGNERIMSLASRLFQDRIILCTGEVTDELAEAIVQQLLVLEAEDKDKPITMIVSGPGGSVTAGFSIISTMNMIACPVYTTVTGQVASMSAVIAASGEIGHRKIQPYSRVMLHTVSSGVQGKVQDITVSYEEIKRLNDLVLTHLGKCCGKKLDQIKKDCDRDFWMSEKEAVEYSVCDIIVKNR